MQSRAIALGGLVLGLALLSSAACGGGRNGEASQASKPKPRKPGGRFTVRTGGRSLSGRCEGSAVSGQPTFVLEAGQGNAANELHPVAQALERIGLVCSYDRAGFGGSDPVAANPRRLDDLLKDLRTVLAGEIPKPYLLVGHSLGGSVVLLYAQLHPDEVAGVVSMNPGPTYHDWLRRLGPIVTGKELLENEIRPLTGSVPEEPVDTRGSDALLAKPFPQHVPYTIMYAEDCGGGTDPYCNKVVGQLEATQRALAALSPEGRFVAVKGAGHEIFATDLDRIVAAVKDVMDRSR
jgi:pimeloyl-ACP methyl ester carboxylesterase